MATPTTKPNKKVFFKLKSSYTALAVKDRLTEYWIEETGEIFHGTTYMGSTSVFADDQIPTAETLPAGKIAFGKVGGVYRIYGNSGSKVEQIAVEEAPKGVPDPNQYNIVSAKSGYVAYPATMVSRDKNGNFTGFIQHGYLEKINKQDGTTISVEDYSAYISGAIVLLTYVIDGEERLLALSENGDFYVINAETLRVIFYTSIPEYREWLCGAVNDNVVLLIAYEETVVFDIRTHDMRFIQDLSGITHIATTQDGSMWAHRGYDDTLGYIRTPSYNDSEIIFEEKINSTEITGVFKNPVNGEILFYGNYDLFLCNNDTFTITGDNSWYIDATYINGQYFLINQESGFWWDGNGTYRVPDTKGLYELIGNSLTTCGPQPVNQDSHKFLYVCDFNNHIARLDTTNPNARWELAPKYPTQFPPEIDIIVHYTTETKGEKIYFLDIVPENNDTLTCVDDNPPNQFKSALFGRRSSPDGASWEVIPESASSVSSVNGKTGAVTLNNTDVGAAATNHNHSVATKNANGFMSAQDKKKLDSLPKAYEIVLQAAAWDANKQINAGLSVPFTGDNIILDLPNVCSEANFDALVAAKIWISGLGVGGVAVQFQCKNVPTQDISIKLVY